MRLGDSRARCAAVCVACRGSCRAKDVVHGARVLLQEAKAGVCVCVYVCMCVCVCVCVAAWVAVHVSILSSGLYSTSSLSGDLRLRHAPASTR